MESREWKTIILFFTFQKETLILNFMNTLSSAENTNPFEELYQKVGKLNLLELEELTAYIFDLRRKKLSTVLSEKEQVLIEQINKPLPKNIQERYNFLRDKKSNDSLV